MKLTTAAFPDRFEIRAEGRLDAAWAEHFLEATRRAVREGHHQLRLDASALEYLSSAGLRSILQTHREIVAVRGSFKIVRASDFVVQTLHMSGFDSLLALDEGVFESPDAAKPKTAAPPPAGWKTDGAAIETYPVAAANAPLRAARHGHWKTWTPIDYAACREVQFGATHTALGIGTPGQGDEPAAHFGDFLSVAGCTAYLPGDGSEAPDYLVGTGNFVPKLRVVDALRATGAFTHLLRFQPADGGKPLTLDCLLEGAFATTGAKSVAIVALAEVDGLVGMSWARSPGLIAADSAASEFPAVREWLAFSGERVHSGELALVVAFACSAPLQGVTLPALPSHPGWYVHAHAAIFPFSPLPNGAIDLAPTVQQLFSTAAPQALLHLVEDDRPALGLGRSAFIRGACWCAPVHFTSEDLS
jgi:anti-anti-sigma factor